MQRPRVTYTTNYYRGGLGDFFNGGLSLFALVRDCADFQIWLPSQIPLAACFDLLPAKPAGPHLLLDATAATMHDAPAQAAQILAALKTHGNLVITTNIGTFVPSEVLAAAVPAFMSFFKPAAAVDRRRAQLLENAGIRGQYISLHVRCGDGYTGSPNCYCPGDRRLDPEMAFAILLGFVCDRVLEGPAQRRGLLGCDQEDDLPIILHTDNAELRARVAACIPELRVLGGSIQHTAEPGGDCVDTVAEFYVVGGAQKIYYMVDSGFTRMPALLFGVKRQQI